MQELEKGVGGSLSSGVHSRSGDLSVDPEAGNPLFSGWP